MNSDELEALLSQKDASVVTPGVFSQAPNGLSTDGQILSPEASGMIVSTTHAFNNFSSDAGSSSVSPPFHGGNGFPQQNMFTPTSTFNSSVSTVLAGSSFGLDVTWPSWPPNLPGPDLLRHL